MPLPTETNVIMTTDASRSLRNVDEFKASFKKNSDAAIGVYVIRTREIERCASVMQDIAIEKEQHFLLWKCNEGWQEFPEPGAGLSDTIDISKPLKTIEGTIDIGKAYNHVCKATGDAVFVMCHPHFHFDKPLIQQYIHDFVQKAREFTQRLVMIVPDTAKIPVEIEDAVHVMDFRPPSHAELVECYTQTVESIEEKARPDFNENEINTIIQNAVGMTWMEFETALALGIVEMQNILDGREDKDQHPDDYIKIILEHKTEAIKKSDLLELLPSSSMSEVGGLDLLKEWLEKRGAAYSPEAREYGIKAPKGFLTVGPPGGGKSLVAKATSSKMKVPLIKFDIGKVFGKFVGESEGRIRSALQMIESMAPCILLLDEIDKAFAGMAGGGGGGDGGISQRVFGSFLSWMQDRDNEKYPVFIVMTANNVTGLPPELMRRGRLDEIFAVTFPSTSERVEILDIHLRKRGHTKVSKAELLKVAEKTEKYVGAELEGIVENSLLEAYNANMDMPDAKLMIRMAEEITPLSTAFADRVNAMQEWAKNNAKMASSGMQEGGVNTAPKTALPGPGRGGIRKLAIAGPKTKGKPETF